MTRHTDPLDKAQDLAQQMNDLGVQTVQGRLAPEQVRNEDGSWPHVECVECGDDIPSERLAWGRIRCVHCQSVKERKANGY